MAALPRAAGVPRYGERGGQLRRVPVQWKQRRIQVNIQSLLRRGRQGAASGAGKVVAAWENGDLRGDAARVLAAIGDTARSEMLIADLSKEFPYDTLLNQMKLPEARALISLQHNQPAQAVAALDSAKPYELGTDRRVQGKLSAIDIRAQAFLQVRDGVKAAEYQKILDHPGIDPTSPLCSLAHLGLGRAYALPGDTAKAKAAYQDFFAIWKGADADVPVLKTPKAEYEQLKEKAGATMVAAVENPAEPQTTRNNKGSFDSDTCSALRSPCLRSG